MILLNPLKHYRSLKTVIKKYGFIEGLRAFYASYYTLYLWHFNKKKLEEEQAKVIGKCKNCGKCCEGCKYLTSDKKCSIYNQRLETGHIGCVYSPMPLDLKSGLRKNYLGCGFRLDDSQEKSKWTHGNFSSEPLKP